jgi:hypothetical protein
MLVRPWLLDLDLVDRLLETAPRDDRDSEPLNAIGGLDAVAVVPMPLDVLRTVKHHILVASADKVEKTLPWNVAGLDDANAHVMTRDSMDFDVTTAGLPCVRETIPR